MRGKVLVFYANAIIFLTLALLGLFLALYLIEANADCGPEPSATCERGYTTGQASLGVSVALFVASLALAVIAATLHRRELRSG